VTGRHCELVGQRDMKKDIHMTSHAASIISEVER